MESDYEDLEYDDNVLNLPVSNKVEFYEGPVGVAFRIDIDGEKAYSLVSNYYEENDSKEKRHKLYLCNKDAESFLIKEYFKGFYRVKDIDFYDSVDVNEDIFNDEILLGILTENMDMLKTKAWRLPLPKDYLVISLDSEDMNGDGFDDYAVVLNCRVFHLSNERYMSSFPRGKMILQF